MDKGKWRLKQLLKMSVQHIVLPLTYGFWRMIYSKKNPEYIVFADAHHDSIPFSMQILHQKLEEKGYSIIDSYYDYAKLSMISAFIKSVKFMRIYAQAKYVFICDNFLPVASCKKTDKTQVIQLWHSCGLLKKMGYDTMEDIPEHYIGNVYKNYDLVTVSAPCCVEPLTSGMHQPNNIVQATGVSRTDVYFDEKWVETCKTNFLNKYPEAKNKKIILWAPTFRGNAANPYLIGVEGIQKMEEQLGSDYWVIYKVHPHLESRYQVSNCDIPTEQLLPVVDLLITDYSSIVFDYIFFDHPYVLYAPDWKEYEKRRGFYVPYESLSRYIVTQSEDLEAVVKRAMDDSDREWIKTCRDYHVAACDGNVSERIMEILGL